MTTFENTKAALAIYDAGEAERDARWDNARSNDDADAAEAEEKAAARLVQEAFHKDTAGYNTLENCLQVRVLDIKQTLRVEASQSE